MLAYQKVRQAVPSPFLVHPREDLAQARWQSSPSFVNGPLMNTTSPTPECPACTMGNAPILVLEEKSESSGRRTRLHPRMKKARRNVVPTLTIRKSWLSCIVLTFMEPRRDLSTPGSQVHQIPRGERPTKARWNTHTVSPGQGMGGRRGCWASSRK